MSAGSNGDFNRPKRPNGAGSISFYRGRWIARYSYRCSDGVRRRKSYSAATVEEAEKWLRENIDEGRAIQPRPETPRLGTVYFVQGVDGGLIKIGFATNLKFRVETMQTGSPVILKVLHAIKEVDRSTEIELHERFACYRIRGEWFEPCRELLEYIDQLKMMRSLGRCPLLAHAQPTMRNDRSAN